MQKQLGGGTDWRQREGLIVGSCLAVLPEQPARDDVRNVRIRMSPSQRAAMRTLEHRTDGLIASPALYATQLPATCRVRRDCDGRLTITPAQVLAPHLLARKKLTTWKVVVKDRETGKELWARPFASRREALVVWVSLLDVDIGHSPRSLELPGTWTDGDLVYEFATVVTFNSTPGGGTWTVPSGVTKVDYLVVAGGGGGGDDDGGGGAGGGMRVDTNYAVTPGGTPTVTVGTGGPGAAGGSSTRGTNGNNSVFDAITSSGGGGGGAGDPAASTGSNGGAGGGAGGDGTSTAGGTGNAGGFTPSEGAAGGTGSLSGSRAAGGGGGGGASGVTGGNGVPGSGAGAGGNGTASSISGSAVTYAGGGGGGTTVSTTPAAGGSGGGGAGGVLATNSPVNGTTNLGGGGGGGGNSGGTTSGANGGTGVVILSYTILVFINSDDTSVLIAQMNKRQAVAYH